MQKAQSLVGTFHQEFLDRLKRFTEAVEGKWHLWVDAFNPPEDISIMNFPYRTWSKPRRFTPCDYGIDHMLLCDAYHVIASGPTRGPRQVQCLPGAWIMEISLASNAGIGVFWDSRTAADAPPLGKAWLRISLFKAIEDPWSSPYREVKEPRLLTDVWYDLEDSFPKEPGWSETSSPILTCYTCDIDFVRFMADPESVADELKPLLDEDFDDF
jgi:hypothetical protein